MNIIINIDKNVGTFRQGSEMADLYDGKYYPGKVGTDRDLGYRLFDKQLCMFVLFEYQF